MWKCLAGGCSGGPFAGQNATKARFHAAQVKGGGIKVCDGVLDEHLFGALVADLHRRNELGPLRDGRHQGRVIPG